MPHMQKSEGTVQWFATPILAIAITVVPKKAAFLELAEGERGHVVGTE